MQVDWETASGAVNMVLIHQLIANAYQNVSNVVLAIIPKSAPPAAKAVLLNAHFDNTLSSPGMLAGVHPFVPVLLQQTTEWQVTKQRWPSRSWRACTSH